MQKTLLNLGKVLVGLLLAVGGAACSGDAAAPAVSTIPATTLPATVIENTAVPPTLEPPAATTQPTNEPTAEALPEPIEVTYTTPAQAEGPYYPAAKPDDHDNDLTAVAGAAGRPAGQILEFSGKLYDAAGMPVSGAIIEIWQTDNEGIYDHPGDPNTARRDMNFQFYGEAETAVDGRYQFRTLLPGEYEPRPRHIHVKIKSAGEELLTTQFYFEGDPALAGGDSSNLIMSLTEGQDAAGNPILIGQRDIVLSTTLPNN